MESASSFSGDFSSLSFYIAFVVSGFCFLVALLVVRLSPSRLRQQSKSLETDCGGGSLLKKTCNCSCSCNTIDEISGPMLTATGTYVNGNTAEMHKRTSVVVDRPLCGASMMEQLVPEITTHALSYLDYPSLCRLSMTNSSMRKAANDDNAWKALYHKDFTVEQDSVTPVNGWKAYYAATRAIVNINSAFFEIIKEKSLQAMSRFWLNADYVKCVHASGEFFTGYDTVMDSWRIAFSWEEGVNFQVRDVRARVMTDMAWVTMKTYVDMETGLFNVTNVFEFHNGRWFMVHHHSSVMLADGEVAQQIVNG